MNPQNPNSRQWITEEIIAVEGAAVISAPTHDGNDGVRHHVEVKPDTFEETVVAEVAVQQKGDVNMPTEGSRVVVGYRPNARPVVLGARYERSDSIPDFEPGERVVGHPTTDSYIRLHNDGTVTIEGDEGNAVELLANGTVRINDGSTAPITDITTTTDGDGDVQSVDVTRADGVFVPSN